MCVQDSTFEEKTVRSSSLFLKKETPRTKITITSKYTIKLRI